MQEEKQISKKEIIEEHVLSLSEKIKRSALEEIEVEIEEIKSKNKDNTNLLSEIINSSIKKGNRVYPLIHYPLVNIDKELSNIFIQSEICSYLIDCGAKTTATDYKGRNFIQYEQIRYFDALSCEIIGVINMGNSDKVQELIDEIKENDSDRLEDMLTNEVKLYTHSEESIKLSPANCLDYNTNISQEEREKIDQIIQSNLSIDMESESEAIYSSDAELPFFDYSESEKEEKEQTPIRPNENPSLVFPCDHIKPLNSLQKKPQQHK